MSNQVTITGNLTRAPELRFTPSGAAVVNFTVADTPRRRNKTTQEWEDGDTLFLDCTAWKGMAENIAESLDRGMRVTVSGRLTQRSWEDKDGGKRTKIECQVDEVGPSLKHATARVTKTDRSGGQPQEPQADSWAGSRNDDTLAPF